MNIFTMKEYCEKVREYIELYDATTYNKTVYGDFKEKLHDLVNSASIEEGAFVLSVIELMRGVTAIMKDKRINKPYVSWIGGINESFTKEYFIKTLKEVWPELGLGK